MVNSTKLFILFDNNGSFTDLSTDLNDWIRGTQTFDYTLAQDYLYLGRYKPFNTVWVELSTANVTTANMVLQYYNGTTWTTLTPDLDDTKGFTRSGWIRWSTPSDWAATTVNSLEKNWVRLSFSATFVSSSVLQAIGLVFCDDQILKTMLMNYDITLPSGETSHLLRHVAARDEIVNRLKQQKYLKLDAQTTLPRPYNEWDLFHIEDVQQAAKHKALQLIYFGQAKTQDDGFMEKSLAHEKEYEKAMQSVMLALDTDEDGFEEAVESAIDFMQPRLTRK